jgi:hypothetical protein
MDRLFAPIRLLRERHGPNANLGFTEVRLAVSIEEFVNDGWDWSDLYDFATGAAGEMWKVLWITEDTFIWVNTQMNFVLLVQHQVWRATFTATNGQTQVLALAMTNTFSSSLSAGASSVFWHAVTTSNCVKLRLEHQYSVWCKGLCSGPALLHFLGASPSLELLEFIDFDFEEAHCRAFATLERTGLEVTFEKCSFDAQDATGTFIEWLRHSQVVTELDDCSMEHIIISALDGNSSVKSLSFHTTTDGRGDDLVRSLALALPGNQGIENLCVSLMRDETWSLLLRSLRAHPRIQIVTLSDIPDVSAASMTTMMNAVLRLVQCNTVVHTIDLPDHAKDAEFFQNSIVPRLEMNRNFFEDQRQALKLADSSIRRQLLGRALHAVRSNPDLLFRILSENNPALFVLSNENDTVFPRTWCCLSRGN